MNQEQINEIRQFNRYYTSILGVINKHFLDSEFTLPEGRVLLELYHQKSVSPSHIIESLQIDKGYLSRILKKFKQQKLITQSTSNTDARAKELSLTKKGTEAYLSLNVATDEQIKNIFKEIPDSELQKLTESMNNIISIINKSNGKV